MREMFPGIPRSYFHLAILLATFSPLLADEPTKVVSISLSEQAVIEALLSQSMLKPTKQRVLVDTAFPFCSPLIAQDPNERRSWPNDSKTQQALDNYILKNTRQAKMSFPRAFSGKIQVVSEKSFQADGKKLTPRDEMAMCLKRFPESDGPIFVSLPGFDAHQTVAIIFMADLGHGQFYYLENSGGKWTLSEKIFGPDFYTD